MPLPWRTAWVTGASSGIGQQVALQLAEAGVKVAASARRLGTPPEHDNIINVPVDVSDEAAVQVAASAIEQQLGLIDLVVLAAGAYEPFTPAAWDTRHFARLNAVNYMGCINCIGAVLPHMMRRQAGQIAIVASVAGYQGLPKAAYYGPTKAALNNLAEALWMELRPHGVKVSVVNPGFVKTPMTAVNDFAMPFLMQPERAAELTIKGLRSGSFEVAYPTPFVLILKALQWLPKALRLRLTSRLTA